MKHAILFSALVLFFASCSKHSLHGSGDTTTETRSLSSFTKIDASGAEEVEILYGPERRAEVTGYRNLLSHYETRISGSTLHLNFDEDQWNVRHNNIHVRIYTPSVQEIEHSGSGSITVLSGGALGISRASLSGSGDMEISQPEVANLRLDIAGSGKILTRNASAKAVEARISGSGDIETTATETLDAHISGSGNIRYWGNPRVSTDVTGSGKVEGH